MAFPKRLRRRRMQVQYRQPNRLEAGPFGESYAHLRWFAHMDEREDGELIVRLTSRTHPKRGDVLQAVICLVVRRWPNATIADLCDLAGCSRETAHRRKHLALQLNAEWDAQLAARRAVARRQRSS